MAVANPILDDYVFIITRDRHFLELLAFFECILGNKLNIFSEMHLRQTLATEECVFVHPPKRLGKIHSLKNAAIGKST